MAAGGRKAARRALRQYMELILAAKPEGETKAALAALGLAARDVNNASAACHALLAKALNGDVRAFCEVRELVGEDGDGKAEDPLERVRELLGGVNSAF